MTGACFYCGHPFDTVGKFPTRDHVFPRRMIRPFGRFLSTDWYQLNIVPGCPVCNTAKGGSSPYHWVHQLDARAADALQHRLEMLGDPSAGMIALAEEARRVFSPV